LELTPRQRRLLTSVRDHHPKPHVREKAAALLKVADGWQIRDVAHFGLLRPRARLLRRLDLRYRRGQEHLYSPDPDYRAKLAAIARAQQEAKASSGRVVLLYLDELTYYRRPSLARCHQRRGGPGAYAEQGYGRNRKRRVIGALEALAGRWHYGQADRAGVRELIRFYRGLVRAYPEAETIYVAQDNWPVHFLPQVLASLEGSPVRLLRLPTYAPWTNPVEKVWRKLKQELLHQHDYRDDWAGLLGAVEHWLHQAGQDPEGLRRYTGLKRRRRKKRCLKPK
jgi:transposase